MRKASKFVLCPRGLSVSSIRLFETMRMGRVPVIVSDGWVPPPGALWDRFSIRVAERDWQRIPEILEAREHEAVPMGERARAVWVEWFSREVAFHRVVEACLAIRARRVVPEHIARWPAYLQPFHFRKLIARFARPAKSAFTDTEPVREERVAVPRQGSGS